MHEEKANSLPDENYKEINMLRAGSFGIASSSVGFDTAGP
jgi:hypothetical protein